MSSVGPRLDLRQSQQLVMTPQLQQAIKLLQLSNLELADYIEKELEQNPLLERDDGQQAENRQAEEATEAGGSVSGEDMQDGPGPRERELDTDFENVWTGNSRAESEAASPSGYEPSATQAPMGKGGSHSFDSPDFSFENTMERPRTLREHLLEQLYLDTSDPQERLIGSSLIDLVDEAGYMRAPVEEVAARLGCAAPRVEAVLKKMQHFDPAGIFARDLKECLGLQLREKNRLDPAMQKLLENLEMLASHDIKKLTEVCGVDADDIRDMMGEIRALNPKPALAFENFVVQTVVPDVVMKPLPRESGGGWFVELNSDTLPRVLVNERYFAEVVGTAKTKQDKAYLQEQHASANWLVRALDQRARTILKVATEIVRQQDAFFLYGIEHLRPLILRDIAGAIEMHESTVSRVTSNKYMLTPRGIFELKYFFTTAIAGADGQAAHSSEAVRARIRGLIDAEKPAAVLSDDDIVEALKSEGIEIARRTVAKYRESMNIPSSVERRRRKKQKL